MPIFVVIAPNLFKLNKILLKDIQSDDETGRDDAVSLEKTENNLASCTQMSKDLKSTTRNFKPFFNKVLQVGDQATTYQ